MDRKKSIFFICVTLIVLALIYYIFKKFKGRTLPTPSPPAQTDELSISDLKFVRTLNPDKSNSESEISGYTIEYDGGINYVKLSQNVTFTIKWKNNIGFNNVVTGFKIEHFVKSPVGTDGATQIFTKQAPTTTTQQVSIIDYGENDVSIVSTNYSVIGDNRFKIYAILNDNTTIELYDGVSESGTSHNINVREEELGATLDMTDPQSVIYTPVVSSTNMTSIIADLTKVAYNITNSGGFNLHGSQSLYLIPATPGSVNDTTGERVNAETFFFQYTDGQYLLDNLSKGDWNEKTERSAVGGGINNDNRMYIAFYNEIDTNESGEKVQLRRVILGYGLGDEFISSDANGTLILADMSSQTTTIPETEYNNSFWKFFQKCYPRTIFLNKLSSEKDDVFDIKWSPDLAGIVTQKCLSCDGMQESKIFDADDRKIQYDYLVGLIPSGVHPAIKLGRVNRATYIVSNDMEPITYSDACKT